MLRQEINLYRTLQPPVKHDGMLNWQQFIYTQLFFLTFLCLIYLYSLWSTHHLAHTKTNLQTEVDSLQQKFIAIKNSYPTLFFSQDGTNTVSSLQHELDAETTLLRSLTPRVPYSQGLAILAANSVPDVWLTAITLSQGSNQMTLKGKSTNIKALQSYINKLTHDTLLLKFPLIIDSIVKLENDPTQANLAFQLTLTDKST